MDKPHRITLIPTFSWRRRAGIFSSTFGFLWMITDPLEFFDITPDWFKTLGMLGYLLLPVISLAMMLIVEKVAINKQLGQLDLIRFIVVVPHDGSQHPIEAPHDMRIDVFIFKFLDYLVSSPSMQQLIYTREMYNWVLLANKKKYIIPSYRTLREGSIEEGEKVILSEETRARHAVGIENIVLSSVSVPRILYPVYGTAQSDKFFTEQ